MNMRWLFLMLVIFTLAACGSNDAESIATPVSQTDTAVSPPLTHIRLPMGYIPDPQYAPFYVSADKGYFAAAGLEIEFDYSLETDGLALVGANELPFAIVSGDQVILARAQGLPVVYVMEWFQRFPIAIVSKTAANIHTPADLAGRKVGLPGYFGASYVGLIGLLSANNLTTEQVNLQEIGFNQVEALLMDQSEAVVVYANNEPVQLQARGEAIDIIYVADFIDMVANGVITNETTRTENPELVRGFVQALLHGLADTLADPAAAYAISQKFVEGLDESRQNVLLASLPLWQAETLGWTEATSWEQTQQVLLEMGLLDAPVADLGAAFTNEFVQP